MKHDLPVDVRPAQENELERLFKLMTEHNEWTRFNAPYFPYSHPTLADFADSTFQRLLVGSDMQLVICNELPVGTVSCYWECEETRWLEAGIVIYDESYWGKGIASIALSQWISYLFKTQEIERVGMTTWSGNDRMMSLATRLGLKQEARLRKVRYYEGIYYDSVKYGVIRSEWEERN
ncbi:GNAT family N-acetyltransferase [Vibrio cholerae]|uniref:GNAT family N-acetyltransferase n=1 Tax=Vibrio cholerae TaxID=666 RepID=UPI001157D223|nr:GNAT family protein [Vibrio cholerae]TQP08500.1 GNAT family N-acetyltransferase [Vibrio cholerae]